MNRSIVGFRQDAEAHWVAELACGHDQHTRHDPPLITRPWVLTSEGRASRIGVELDCKRCDRLEVPDGYGPYRRTTTFTAQSIPDGLRQSHTTKHGLWALIHVSRGRLDYRIGAPFNTNRTLVPGSPGVVPPEVEHSVTPSADVELFVEFWRRPRSAV